jgi:MFS family permease
MGPLFGAVAAARVGFRPSFAIAGTILLGCALLVAYAPSAPPVARATAGRAGAIVWSDVVGVAALVFVGSVHLQFLPAILPEVLPSLGVEPDRLLDVGGFIIFVSGVAAALGAVAASRLGEALPESRLIAGLLVLSSAWLVAFGLANSVWILGALRFLQVLCVAPMFPIVVARIAHRGGGEAIGFINSARIAAAFVGPVAATTLLAWAPAPVVYAAVGLAGAACVPLALRGGATKAPA